jgi:hypothetical protein
LEAGVAREPQHALAARHEEQPGLVLVALLEQSDRDLDHVQRLAGEV